jgi:hypothetical protein
MAISQRLKYHRRGYALKSHDAVLSPQPGKQLELCSLNLFNSTNDVQDLGAGIALDSSEYTIYSFRTGGIVPFDNTLFTTSNGDGFVIQSSSPISMVSFNKTQGQGGSPTYEYAYDTATGTPDLVPIGPGDFTGTGSGAIIINPPHDWVPGNLGFTGLPTNLYTLIVLTGTAPSQDVIVDSIKLSNLIIFMEDVESKQTIERSFPGHQYLLNAGAEVIPYFGVPAADNVVEITYKDSP